MDFPLPQTEALLQIHPAAAGGLLLGSRLDVPPDYAAVFVKEGKVFDTLPPGSHVIDQVVLPLLMQKFKPRSRADEIMPLPVSVFLVPTAAPRSLSWASRVMLSQSPAYGLTYTTLQGRCAVQVADPARFCAVVLSLGSKALAQPGASPVQIADYVLRAGPGGTGGGKPSPKMKLPPEQATAAREALRSAIGQQAAQWLGSSGLHCLSFDLETVAEPDLAPCAGCGSSTVPLAYGKFLRTISLLYVRFTARKEGNFCVPCAWKISAGFNAVMLVCGWWGYIGLVLTPVYFFQNLYHLTRIVSGPKSLPRLSADRPPRRNRRRRRHLAAPADANVKPPASLSGRAMG